MLVHRIITYIRKYVVLKETNIQCSMASTINISEGSLKAYLAQKAAR